MSGNWPTGPEGVALFRAWLVSVMATIANLGPRPLTVLEEMNTPMPPPATGPKGSAYFVEPMASTRVDNQDWQRALAAGVIAIAGRKQFLPADFALPDDATISVQTVDGGPAVASSKLVMRADAAFLPAIPIATAAVIVLVSGILAGATAWVASNVLDLARIGLAGHEKTQLAVAAMSSATQVLEQHQVRETAAGSPLSYDPEELQTLGTLRQTIRDVTNWQPPDLKGVPDLRDLPTKVTAGLGTFAVIGLLVYVLTEKRRARAA